MKKILLPSFIIAGLYAHAQVDVTASAGTPSATYTTLKDAFDKVNDGTHSGTVNLSITANTTETATAVLNAGNSYTSLTIKPATTAAISGAITGSPLVQILGSNVTIDGSATVGGTTRNLTFRNTSITTGSVLYMGSPTAETPLTNVTVKNAVLQIDNNSSTSIILANGSTTAGYFNNITVQNNEMKNGFNGLFISANTAAGNGANLLITGNTISSIIQNGIYVAGVGGASTISNNTISVVNPNQGTSASTPAGSLGINLGAGTTNASVFDNTISVKNTSGAGNFNYATGIAIAPGTTNTATKVYNNTITEVSGYLTYINSSGIYVSGFTPNVSIYSNKISGMLNTKPAGAIFGLALASTSTTSNIISYNNVISDLKASTTGNTWGVYLASGGGYKLYNNTVNLNTGNAETGVSGALYVAAAITTANTLDIKNNIFANNKPTGSTVAVYSLAAQTVFGGNMDYNIYDAGTALGYIASTAHIDIAGMRTGFGGNANSLDTAPVFVSPTDMHLLVAINPGLDNMGTAVGVLTDMDNIKRRTTPDIGAYEFGLPNCLTVAEITPYNGSTGVAYEPTNISWAVAGGAKSYKLNLGTTPGGTNILNGTVVNSTTYNITLSANTTYYLKVTPFSNDGDASGCTESEIVFTTNPTMGVADLSKANISIYPNPFADVVKISDVKGVKNISVNDMSGRQVKSLAPANELNLSGLQSGMYIINLNMEDGSVKSIKTIKK